MRFVELTDRDSRWSVHHDRPHDEVAGLSTPIAYCGQNFVGRIYLTVMIGAAEHDRAMMRKKAIPNAIVLAHEMRYLHRFI